MEHTLEAMLVGQCAPTLAGIKPANLFRYSGGDTANIRQAARYWDGELRPCGVRLIALKECPASGACLLFAYRPAWLGKLLQEQHRRTFLAELGYPTETLSDMLAHLSGRLCLEGEYPHEIGLFLGYPLRDVRGFMENRAQNYVCCGCWKAYGDPEAARKCFARYRACTDILLRRYAGGVPLLQLVKRQSAA